MIPADLPMIEDFSDPGFDPFIADELLCGTVEDPYPVLHEMMSRKAVHEVEYRTIFSKYSSRGR